MARKAIKIRVARATKESRELTVAESWFQRARLSLLRPPAISCPAHADRVLAHCTFRFALLF